MPKEKKNKKEKKSFFKDFKAELKKVIWPTPKQLFNNTLAVIVIVIVVGVIVFALDVCFEKVNSLGVEKLKTIVENLETEENSTTNNESSNETNDTSNEATENVDVAGETTEAE